MITNAAKTIAADPAASPSRPSVMLTAFEKPYTQNTASTSQSPVARSTSNMRVNDRCVDTFT